MAARPARKSGWGQALGWFVVLAALLLLCASWLLRQAGQPLVQLHEPTPPTDAGAVQAPISQAPGQHDSAPPPGPGDAAAGAAPESVLVSRTEAEPPAPIAIDAAGGAAHAPITGSAAAPAEPTATPAPHGDDPLAEDIARLAARRLTLPVRGVGAGQLIDTYTEARAGGARSHEAIDIMAPAGTPVLAVEDGRVARLFFSQGGGGITLYQFDPDEQYAYYYAHLERYADGLRDGQPLRRGQVIGYVGASGNANPQAPHLHFAIFKLGPDKRWWKGEALNPYPVLRGR